MKIVCAWCQTRTGTTDSPTWATDTETHGCCPSCLEKQMAQAALMFPAKAAPALALA